MQITIVLDEDMLENALSPVLSALHRLEDKFDTFVQYEVSADQEENYNMGVVTDKLTAGMEELSQLRTVTDGILTWSQTQSSVLTDLRAQLATAIENGATTEDLAGLDEFIAGIDTESGRLASVLTEGTPVEGETPSDTTEPTDGSSPSPI